MLEAISARDIAVSGLKAQRTALNVIANNIANAYTTRTASGGPFRRQFALIRGESLKPTINPTKYGVHVKRIQDDPSPFRMVYDPQHPDANEEGYVSMPNVDVSMEMVNMVVAQRAYDANIAVMSNDSRMSQRALELLQA